jgi:Reverse transcriptase (RNA-dependent DNA polymerase)
LLSSLITTLPLSGEYIVLYSVFDIKMDFTWKAWFVAGGHTMEAHTSLTYSSVVSHDSIRIAFLIAVLNDIDIMSCDLKNAYLNAPCCEKIWFEGGLECGEDRGKVCVIVHSLYRLKSAGAVFRVVLAQLLQDLGYTSLKANPDVWMCKAVTTDGHKYYEMLFVYVDNILALSHQATECE